MLEHAEHRRANFFRGTMRDPDAHTVPDALEAQALATVATNIEAQAMAEGRVLDGFRKNHALAVAQRLLRSLPREQLQSIGSSAGLLKSITAQSLAGTPIGDLRIAAALQRSDGPGASMADAATLPFGRRSEGADRAASGARFSDIGGSSMSSELARTMEVARHEAVRLGIPWAANQPDLLKLGPAAVRAVAEVNLKQHSYQRLRGDAHFAAKDVVTFAHYAKSKGITDANAAAGAVADFVQLGTDHAEQLRLKTTVTTFMAASNAAGTAPNDAAAQERLRQAGETFKATATELSARSPDAAETVQRMQRENRIPEIYRAAAQQTAKAEHKEQTADDLYAQAAAPAKVDARAAPAAAPATAPAATPAVAPATDAKTPPAQPAAKPPAPK